MRSGHIWFPHFFPFIVIMRREAPPSHQSTLATYGGIRMNVKVRGSRHVTVTRTRFTRGEFPLVLWSIRYFIYIYNI